MNQTSSFNSTYMGYDILQQVYTKLIIATLWSTLTILGIIGNGMVIYIGIKYKKLKNYTNCFIFNLALTDLLFVIFCIPFTTFIYVSENWPYGILICKLSHFLSHASVQTTCITLCVMTIYKVNVIIKNKQVIRTFDNIKLRRRSVFMIPALIWLVSFLLSFPDLIFYSVSYSTSDGKLIGVCLLKVEQKLGCLFEKFGKPFTIITTYVIPLLIIVLSYSRLISFLMYTDRRMITTLPLSIAAETSVSGTIQMNKIESEDAKVFLTQKLDRKKRVNLKTRRVTRLVTVVTLNFAICWLPAHLFMLIVVFIKDMNLSPTAVTVMSIFKLIAHTLSYLTPILNPITYGFYNESFGKPLKQIMGIPSTSDCRINKKKSPNTNIYNTNPSGQGIDIL